MRNTNKEENERFKKWGFDGDMPHTVQETYEKWNRLHGDLMIISPEEHILDAIDTMFKIFEEYEDGKEN